MIIWNYIPGYTGIYAVSSDGQIKSMTRLVPVRTGNEKIVNGRILVHKTNADGYKFVTLSKNGHTRTMYVHRAVALAFLANPGGLPEVNHKDGNKSNNAVDNLEWVTHQQNVQHCYDCGFCKNTGGNHHMAIGVTDNQLQMTFGTIKEWCVAREINYSTGRNILSGSSQSKIIDLTAIYLQKKIKSNG